MTTYSVNSGVTSSGRVLGSGDYEYVNGGGRSVSTVVNTSGTQIVTGTAVSTLVTGASARQRVSSGGVASQTIVSAGGSQFLDLGGRASGTVVRSGGFIYDYGTTSGTTVSAGGIEYVSNDGGGISGTSYQTTVASGGRQVVLGTAVGTVILNGGTQVIGPSGTASGTVINIGAKIDLQSLPYLSNGTVAVNTQNVLTVTEGTRTYRQQLGAIPQGKFFIQDDGTGGTLIYTVDASYLKGDEGSGGGGLGQDSGSSSSDNSSGNDNGGGAGGSDGSRSGADDFKPLTTHGTPVHRFFDAVHGTQFLTSSNSEMEAIKATRPDLTYEGVALDSIPDATLDARASPVFRFFDSIYGTHFYSSSLDERNGLIATRPDLTYEGVAFNQYTALQPNSAPVYRFFESTNGTHFYTSSETERSSLLQTRPDMIGEGVAFYSPTS